MKRFEALDALVQHDIQLRQELVASGELFGDYNSRMEALHIENGKQLDSLLTTFGWPDASGDGEEAVKNAWYIVMHAISLPTLQRNVLKSTRGTSRLMFTGPSRYASRQSSSLLWKKAKIWDSIRLEPGWYS